MIFCTLFKIGILLPAVGAGKSCPYDYSNFTFSYQTKYCEYGCCDTKYSAYSAVCCTSSSSGSSSSSTSEVPVEIIVGSVLGSLVGLSVMIVIIRCICAALKNSSRQIVKIIQPANTNTPDFVVNTATLQGQAITHVQQGEAGYVYPCAGSTAPIDQYEYVSPPLIDQYEYVSPPPIDQYEYVSPPPIDQYEYVSPHPTYQYEHMSPPPTDQYEYISPTPHRHHDKESQQVVNQEVKY